MQINSKYNFNNQISVSGDIRIANKRPICVLETPVRFNGTCTVNGNTIGAFTYFSGENSKLHAVKSIGRFCMINGDVIAGMAEQDVRSLSAHFMFGTTKDNWTTPFHNLSAETLINNHAAQRRNLKRKSDITIGNDVWIGHGAQIMSGVTIGDGAVIAAGAVVTHDIEPYTIVAGVPAVTVRRRFEDAAINKLLELQWWNYGPNILNDIDTTQINTALNEIEQRIQNGFPMYQCDKYIFDQAAKTITHTNYAGSILDVIRT